MGIIAKQGIISTVLNYIGIVLGFVTTGLLFPHYLTTAEIGILTLLVSYSSLFGSFGNLGTQAFIVRLFPFFHTKDSRKHHGILALANTISFFGFLLIIVLYKLLKGTIISESDNSEMVAEYMHYLPILIFATIFFMNFDAYNRALHRSVIGVFMKEFMQRLFILLAILIFLVTSDFKFFVGLYVLSLCLPTLIILVDIIVHRTFTLIPDFRHVRSGLVRKIADTSLFGILFGFGNVIVQRLDIIMLSWYTTLSLTGVYNISLFFGTIVSTPARAIQRISTTILSDAFKREDLKTVETVYSKSCLNQFAVGVLIFIGIVINLDNVYKILPDEYEEGRMVIIYYGLTALSNMLFGLSSSVIGISPYYRYQTWFTVIFAIIIITTNLIFIPLNGITGAAFASFLSTLIYGLMMFFFLKWKYNFKPFNYKYLLILLFSGLIYLIGYFLPILEKYFILDIFYRSILVTIVYLFLLLVFNISEDITRIFYKTLTILKNKIK